jgi:hypothetical protein
MVARLKLKGIDGRAPPGVNASFTTFKAVVNSAPKSIRSKLKHHGAWIKTLLVCFNMHATLTIAGNP